MRPSSDLHHISVWKFLEKNDEDDITNREPGEKSGEGKSAADPQQQIFEGIPLLLKEKTGPSFMSTRKKKSLLELRRVFDNGATEEIARPRFNSKGQLIEITTVGLASNCKRK